MPKITFHSGAIINGKPIEVECIPILNKNKCVILSKEYGLTVFDLKELRVLYSTQILDTDYRIFLLRAVRLWLKHPRFLSSN